MIPAKTVRHAVVKRAARRGVPLVLEVTRENLAALEQLVARGLFGRTVEAVADELVRAGLRQLEMEGWCGTNKRAASVSGICRVCGCTDLDACPGGCSWVEPDLCSACVEELVIPEPPATPPLPKKKRARQRARRRSPLS